MNRAFFLNPTNIIGFTASTLIIILGLTIIIIISDGNAHRSYSASTNLGSSNSSQTRPLPGSITITSNSGSVYSITSSFSKVDKFATNYTIDGEISHIKASGDLITSTIINDFDSSPNIGYVKSNSSSVKISSQPTLPNPFESKDTINQKIIHETQDAITLASAANPVGKSVQIRCTFGMVLAYYRCS